MKESVPVTDRKSLLNLLNSVCKRTYRKIRQDLTLEFEQNLLKTYVIEAHPNGKDGEYDEYASFLDESLKHWGAYIQKTDDPSLVVLVRGHIQFYVDIYDPRYWMFHTISRSDSSDKFVKEMVRQTPYLDCPWLPAQSLEKLASSGSFVGFGTEFDSVPTLNITGRKKPIIQGESLSFRLRKAHGTVDEDYRKLRQPAMYQNALRLSTIRLRYGDYSDSEDYSVDEITFWGKLTARGPSFDYHNALAMSLVRDYREQIKTIEKTCFIDAEKTEVGLCFHGHPVSIRYQKQPSLDVLVGALFSTGEPFRLWGVPERISDRLFSVHAVDLHVGSMVRFEVTDKFLRIYMSKGSCGNTVARLFANIQRHVDSEANLVLGSGETAFERAPQVT